MLEGIVKVKIALLVFFTGVLVAFSVAGYIVGNAANSGILTTLKSDDIDKSNNTIISNSS